MMLYCCSRCGYESKLKHHVFFHVNHRKKRCKPNVAEIEPSMLENRICHATIDDIRPDSRVITQTNEDVTQISIDEHMFNGTAHIAPILNENAHTPKMLCEAVLSAIVTNNPLYCVSCGHTYSSKQMFKAHKCKGKKTDRLKCDNCDKTFSTKYNSNRHFEKCEGKRTCNDKKTIKDQKTALQEKDMELQKQADIIKSLKQELATKNQISAHPSTIINGDTNNTTNNTTNTTNTTNNIIIMTGYGNENVEHILQNKDKLLENIARQSGNPVDFYTEAFKAIYFNPEYPENQNLKMTNSRGNLVTVTRKDKHGELYEDSEDQARFFPKVLCDVQKFTNDGRKNINNEKLRDKAYDLEREMKLFPIRPVPRTLPGGAPRPLSKIEEMEKQRDLNLKSAENERKSICTSLKNDTIIETKKQKQGGKAKK